VRANLVKDFLTWPWSSLSAYSESAQPWVNTSLVLNQFGGSPAQAVPRFQRFLKAGLKTPPQQWAVKDGRYVMENQNNSNVYLQTPKKSTGATEEVPSLSDDDFLMLVTKTEGISVEDLRGRNRRDHVVMIRQAMAEAVHEWWGWDGTRTAILLNKTPSTVAKIYRRHGKQVPQRIKSRIAAWKALLVQRQRPI
jgi:hypothetical protein